MVRDRAGALIYLNNLYNLEASDAFRYVLNFFRVRKEIETQFVNFSDHNLMLVKRSNAVYYSVLHNYINPLTFTLHPIAIDELVQIQRIDRFNEQFKAEYKNYELRLNLDSLALTKKLLGFLFYED